MSPSTLIKHGDRKILVIFSCTTHYKRDTLGRRIRGTDRSGPCEKILVGWYDPKVLHVKHREYAPPMGAQEAARKFIEDESHEQIRANQRDDVEPDGARSSLQPTDGAN